jgi:hypothetical protein
MPTKTISTIGTVSYALSAAYGALTITALGAKGTIVGRGFPAVFRSRGAGDAP